MKRFLLFAIMCVCVSIGAWAATGSGFSFEETPEKWHGTENVVVIQVSQAGGLAAALEELYRENGNSGNKHYSGLFPFTTLRIESSSSIELSAADIAALNAARVEASTIDIQDLQVSNNSIAISNTSVKYLILPDGWEKVKVKAAVAPLAGSSNFEAALSQQAYSSTTAADAHLVAYVKKPGSLYNAMTHTCYDGHPNTKMGTISYANSQMTYTSHYLGYVSIMGYPSARDFSTGESNLITSKYNPDGHFEFDKEADETVDPTNGFNTAVGGGKRQLLGESMVGALARQNTGDLIQLDLGDAIIYDEWNSDLTLSASGVIGNRTKEIIFPTCSELKTIPADCLNMSLPLLEEICIPGNIEYIKTRSFYISNQVMRHIWTTGTTEHMRYDNGAYLHDDHENPDHYGHAPLDDPDWNNGKGKRDPARYGTITLPENLKLIESHCFTSRSVSDVYVLSKVAPECHVDAFSSIMYMGNNTIDTQYTNNQGMITRWSYAQGDADGEYICFLHYPRECGTPEIQRYTDPTREYSVATTWRDGKGNVVYFPNQSEFNRAYIQGTTGYLWYAWDSERVPEPAGNANSFANANPSTSGGHTTALQQTANDLYIANAMTDPDKTDRSFYDVRLDVNGQPTLTKPSDLKWYYNTEWEGKQLYPEMEYTNTETVIGQQQRMDENGKPAFVVGDCDYVQDYTMNANANGTFVENINVDANGAKVRDYSYDEDPAGGYVHEILIAEAADGQKVIDFDYVETEGGQYYHPLVSRNWDSSKPKPWYSQTESWVECPESEATHVLPGGWSNAEWRITYAEWAALTYETPNHVFVKSVTQWAEDNNNGSHYISDGWAAYAEGASDFAEGINDTRYNRVQKTPVTYRDYVEATDFGETRYNISDNGIRAYAGAADDEAGYTRYAKNYANTLRDYDATTDDGETRYTVGTGYRTYVANADPDSWLQRYNKNYIAGSYRAFDASKDDANETRYCPDMEDVYGIVRGDTKDYRGWHQFVLHAYDTNDDRPIEPVKFYQTDNDWWTVCLPYDLKYTDMIRFFGNGEGNIPYLSKLLYVVRDYDEQKITLMFSKNLMIYKEVITNPSNTDDYVHGVIDDVTTYTDAELAADPIILHKGVPYLIKPNIDVNAGRSFDVYKNNHELANPDLYQRLVDSRNVPAAQLETYIYKGEYTVPAYVIGTTTEKTVESRSFAHTEFGPTFTYNSSAPITYKGKQVNAKISDDFCYTFVGSYFLSMMPQYSYFLGWDSKNKRAAFWYNRVPRPDSYDWNNQTGIICANFNTSKTIDPATSLSDPARWILAASDVKNDDLVGVTNNSKYNTLGTMDWGGSVIYDFIDDEEGIVTDIQEVKTPIMNTTKVYTLNGVYVGNSVAGLAKGLYIVNGKKYVVK